MRLVNLAQLWNYRSTKLLLRPFQFWSADKKDCEFIWFSWFPFSANRLFAFHDYLFMVLLPTSIDDHLYKSTFAKVQQRIELCPLLEILNSLG